jgi:cation transport ATPase
VEDENISMLFYHSYIEDVLREFDETEADKITPEFVLEEVEKAAKFKEKKIERTLREKEGEFLQQLKEAVSKKGQEDETKLLERLEKIKNSLKESAERKAKRDSWIYASVLTLLVLALIYGLYLACKKGGAIEFLTVVLPLIIGGSGIIGVWTKIRRRLKNKLSNHIYKQKLKETRLDE